jgi:negative regulator of replication initiation
MLQFVQDKTYAIDEVEGQILDSLPSRKPNFTSTGIKMFANLKKKIESEVGDLSRLTPNLRSVTQSEKMTPLSSRHNSVSSLASETSYTTKMTSPMSPNESYQGQSLFGSGGTGSSGGMGAAGGRSDNTQQKLKRIYEEKLQTQELDFAWRLNSKDDEISKLQKQVEHINTLLHSKEFETQQKLVRVQEDMDSLEGFSQQENAKIKHLLLNREEELSQLRATVMMKESAMAEIEAEMKSITVENDRLKKSLDEVVGRQGNLMSALNKAAEDEELKKKLSDLEGRVKLYDAEHRKTFLLRNFKIKFRRYSKKR